MRRDPASLGGYLVVTANYWAFTLTDGALRMLVVLHFHRLGYDALEIALLFVFYELFGVITNLTGGYLAARVGLTATLLAGTALQVLALAALAVPAAWLTVPYVMAAQAASGIAKDLNKMSAKSSVRVLVPPGQAAGRLLRWTALLTGSKNALKGAGFFLGGALLAALSFRGALLALAALLGVSLLGAAWLLPRDLGRPRAKPALRALFAKTPAINTLAGARFFLFGARDVWFVVGLPVYLSARLGWGFEAVGAALAAWVIGYGAVQAGAPRLLPAWARAAEHRTTAALCALLALGTAGLAATLEAGGAALLVGGLATFGVAFALTSALHSYLILAYTGGDKVALDVGFYYAANAGGRLAGTVLSGWLYQTAGLEACLWASAALLGASALVSLRLPAAGSRPAAAAA